MDVSWLSGDILRSTISPWFRAVVERSVGTVVCPQLVAIGWQIQAAIVVVVELGLAAMVAEG